ncbi:type IV secretory system conjugative DNA transfer family protein [Clostridium sp. CF011]|uniref:VirD4-like conjugal transfer protein, CD1115 family n=1 Tax=Clostridium sp. CF011 TaxID=2843318 RepID=UPI001C0D1DF2|nr:type IV secretory system conjugative DNA transfer family protein [Clostridium sp. CF011]MBU3093546.1 type IV secretory system conjugative DNA transfer family protein [Clostridium sp. CF011]WAG71718.1 type IV secretory system conjugative DNA transfer family protein [Clostridium sp. CF011]
MSKKIIIKIFNYIKKFCLKNYIYILLITLITLVSVVLTMFSNLLLASVFKSLGNLKNKSKGVFIIEDVFNFQFKYKTYYLITFALILFTDIKVIYATKMNFKKINKGQKGTSKFTTLKELQQQYKAVPEKEETYKGRGGVVISRYKDKIFIDDSAVNNLVIGTTRSGKGETFVFPTIDVYSRAEEKPSMIINDPKGELASACYNTLIKRGYDIQILNLLQPMKSMSYNPLQLVINAYKNKDYSTAQMLCNTLTFSLYNDPTAKDKFWLISAQSLVNALILAITKDCVESGNEEKITLYTVANFLANKGSAEDEDGKNELDEFFKIRDPFDISKMQYVTSNFAKGTTRGGIFATAMSKIQIFTFDEIAKMTAKNSYDLEQIGFNKKPVAIFMVTPDYDSSNHVIASIFIRQTYYMAAKKASLSNSGRCKREIVYLLDEFGNMPPIEDFSNIITVCLGRNIRFNLIIQSYSQLKKLYGDSKDTIVGNCGNQIYILTSDEETAKSFSEMLGNRTLINNSLSGKELFNKSTTASIDKRELLNKNELMSLREGESVVIRVIKRQDNNKNRITPRPIYNTGETTLKYRYEYLNAEFDTSKSINDLSISSLHKDVDVKKLIMHSEINDDEDDDENDEFVETSIVENETENIEKEKELTGDDKFLIEKITGNYEDIGEVNIKESSEKEIKQLLIEYEDKFSDEDKLKLKKIIGRS